MLTPRQKMILNSIVEEYVRLAEPVGSRALSKHWDIKLSPATIRNEMADLEELGYLEQPHTSAGRIPSQRGYRFYVDHLVKDHSADVQTLGSLRGLFQERMDEVERVIQQAATVLSQLTQYTSIVLGPKMKQEDKVKHIQLVPLAVNKAVVILVTDTGHVENRQVQMSEDISADDVVKMVNLLNSKLVGTPIRHMRSHLYREVANEMANTLLHYEDALALLDELATVGASGEERVYVGGATQILAQPEFRDIDKVKPLLEMLESQDSALAVLPKGIGLHVLIGQENKAPMLQDCSVISTTYTVDGVPVGTLGILGPTRMNYSHVMQMINSVSAVLTKVMTDRITGL